MEKVIPVYCAWCKKHSTKWTPAMASPKGDYRTASHGMCPKCYEVFMGKYQDKMKNAKKLSESKEFFMSFEEFLVEMLNK